MVLLSVERLDMPSMGRGQTSRRRKSCPPSAGRAGPPVKTSGFRVRVGRVPEVDLGLHKGGREKV